MVKKTAYPSTKRYGARYGRKVKNKVGNLETSVSAKTKCPYCRKDNCVSKVAIGIFFCKKCSVKFTGKAYAPAKMKLGVEA